MAKKQTIDRKTAGDTGITIDDITVKLKTKELHRKTSTRQLVDATPFDGPLGDLVYFINLVAVRLRAKRRNDDPSAETDGESARRAPAKKPGRGGFLHRHRERPCRRAQEECAMCL